VGYNLPAKDKSKRFQNEQRLEYKFGNVDRIRRHLKSELLCIILSAILTVAVYIWGTFWYFKIPEEDYYYMYRPSNTTSDEAGAQWNNMYNTCMNPDSGLTCKLTKLNWFVAAALIGSIITVIANIARYYFIAAPYSFASKLDYHYQFLCNVGECDCKGYIWRTFPTYEEWATHFEAFHQANGEGFDDSPKSGNNAIQLVNMQKLSPSSLSAPPPPPPPTTYSPQTQQMGQMPSVYPIQQQPQMGQMQPMFSAQQQQHQIGQMQPMYSTQQQQQQQIGQMQPPPPQQVQLYMHPMSNSPNSNYI